MPTDVPALNEFMTDDELATLVQRARTEDVGPAGVDVTSELFVPETLNGTAAMRARKPGRLAGVSLLPRIAWAYSNDVTLTMSAKDGHDVAAGDTIATFSGPLRSILTLERIALNFCTHLSGIATLTAKYVERCRGTRAKIYDTRKTIPGLRGLQKYAVRCGGGFTHRIGLYDAVLIKDNHLAHVPMGTLEEKVIEAARRARTAFPNLKFVEVEVDNLDQLRRVLTAPVDLVLLDNMSNDDMRRAVAMRDELGAKIELEASGGVNLETVGGIAQTGVDRIAVGALTHSAPALDLGLDIA